MLLQSERESAEMVCPWAERGGGVIIEPWPRATAAREEARIARNIAVCVGVREIFYEVRADGAVQTDAAEVVLKIKKIEKQELE